LNPLKIEINTLEYKEYSTVKHNDRTCLFFVVIGLGLGLVIVIGIAIVL
jgi:hypothetical protein